MPIPREPQRDDNGELRLPLGAGLEALQESGLLFALNTDCLHPLGFEAKVEGGQLFLYGHGERCRQWSEAAAAAVDERWRAFRQTRLDATSACNPDYWGPQAAQVQAAGQR